MSKKITIILWLCAALFTVFCYQAVTSVAEDEYARIVIGSIKIFPCRAPTRVIIGNPAIADVTDVTTSEITLSAKSAGTTNLVYWDAYGEQSIQVKVLAEDVDAIKNRVDNLLAKLDLPEVYTKAEEDEAKVLLLGRVKSTQDTERIKTALGPLTAKTVDLTKVNEEESTIEIDVQILELNKDATSTLGFTWPGSITISEVGAPAFVPTGGTVFGQLFRFNPLQRTPYSLTIDALIKEGKARILSRPRLSCQSGKEAELMVGGEKPVMTTTVAATTGAAGTNVEYKEYGIKLKIKPTIATEDRIKLNLNIEVSDVGKVEILGSEGETTAKAYPLIKRNASTELFLDDTETMAIGGLIKQKTEEDLRKFPWLADVPVLGAFFRQRQTKSGGGATERGDTELFITLTPRIVARDLPSKKEAKKISRPAVLSQEEAFKKTNIPEGMLTYAQAVQLKILRASYYPQVAKDAGWEGDVKLGLRISAQGGIQDIQVLKSSGYKVLDDASVEVARQQAPYPPFPPQIESQDVWVEVPVVYRND